MSPRVRIIRLFVIAAVTYAVGKWALRPMAIDGASMEPTYARSGFMVGNLLAYVNSPPRRGDVVLLRYGGSKWFLLKRLIAFEGETVEFRDGTCLVDGKPLDEPYVVHNARWTEPPRKVRPGNVYVMGDNRGVRFESHVGGEISASRIAGRPLW